MISNIYPVSCFFFSFFILRQKYFSDCFSLYKILPEILAFSDICAFPGYLKERVAGTEEALEKELTDNLMIWACVGQWIME